MINRLIFVVILINFLTTICESEEDSFLLPPSFTLGESPEVSEYNLLDAFTIPLQDPKTQYVGESEDGFPAYGFRIGADVKISYKQILPDILSEEFAILINVKPGSKNGGFIFAIVNAMETIVELGVRIAPENGSTTTLFLYYTDITVEVPSSNILANFTVPKFSYKWTKFAFKVTQDDVTLFFNCTEFETIETHRNPLKLTFESASTLYLAKAGPLIGDAFEGALTHVKIYKDPGMAAEQCKTDFQDFISLQDEETENTIENNEIIEDNFEIISNDINSKVERTDYPPFRREDVDSLGTFPPPPPLPDGGKLCPCGDEEFCCNSFFNDLHAAGKYKGEKGERGPKGTPGESIRGPPGPPGTPGTPGSPGKPAPEATCSCNVTSILSALNGKLSYSPAVSLVPGKEGVPGTPGRPGEKGAIGARGEKGERGERGPPGQRGEQGKDGVPGLPGPPGPSGPPGPTEIDGVNVSDLKKGSSGVPIVRAGIPGSKGEPGQTGNAGTKGDKGSQGSKGALGPKGDRGDRGLPGEKGTQGIKGDAGIDGFPGTPGSKGEIGPPGNPGILTTNGTTAVIDCPPGPRGVDGMPGLKGETGAPGQRGLIGPPGITGEKGQVGLDGGIGPVGSPGSKGEKGDRGPPGEVFLQKGIHGDGEILMLKGEKGELGRRGRRGKPGPQGPIGRIGPPGLPGLKGEKGDSSSASGGSNEKGEKGAPGIPGRDAESRTIPIPGPPGPPGPPGLPGLSITGPKGEPGESIFSEPLFNLRPGTENILDEELEAVQELKDLKTEPAGRSTDSPPIAHAVIQQHQNKKIEPVSSGAMAFKTRNMMLEATKESPIGTMVYIIEEESLLVRVNAGWQYVALGALLHTDTHPTTTSPPHQVHPPFESSNLINQNMLHKIPSIKPKLPPSPSLHSSFDSSILKQELPSRSSSDDVKTTQFATLRIAALNNPYNGKSGGVSGADYDCYREAHRAGLKGTFRAFLSSRAQDVKSIVRDVDRILPVSNLRGEILFDSWSDIFDGRGGTFRHQPRIFSFNGKNVMTDPHWPIKSAWHGALRDGTRALDISCEAWQNFQYDKLGLAGNLKGQMLIDQNPTSCDKKLIVLCIEATSEIYQQRRRRRGTIEYHNNNNDGNEETLLTQEQYSQLLNSIH